MISRVLAFLFFLLISCIPYLYSQHISYPVDENMAEHFLAIPSDNEINTLELSKEINHSGQTEWIRTFVLYPEKTRHGAFEENSVNAIKQLKNNLKLQLTHDSFYQEQNLLQPLADAPSVFKTFEANIALEGTPTDNTLAVSNGGIIVSAINSNIRYYNTSGTELFSKTFFDFLGDTNLKSKLYDPQVIYDSGADRFIFVLLHGSHSSTSRVIVCFSKTNNPLNGWYVYQFPVTTLSSVYAFKWFDFPKIGISNDDLFITGNIFKNDEGGFSESVIIQMTKSNGYQGKTLIWKLWNNLSDADGGKPFSICPVSYGKQGNYGPVFYLLSNKNAGNSNKIYLYEITNKLGSNPQLKSFSLTTNTYYLAGDAVQKRTNQDIDPGLLDIGDCRIQNAFYQISNGEGIIHFVFHSEYNQTYNAINYNRLNLKTMKFSSKMFANASVDYAYPAVVSSSPENDPSKDVVIAFLFASATHFPGLAVVSCDDQMNFSNYVVIKNGLTNVNILSDENERWGDYTGICRKHNTSAPRIWISGAYGANISDNSVKPPVLKPYRYKNFIAEVADNQITEINEEVKPEDYTVNIYPNPVVKTFQLSFDVREAGMLEISLVQADGKFVTALFRDYVRQGKAIFSFNSLALKPGIYFVRISRENKQIMYEKMVVSD